MKWNVEKSNEIKFKIAKNEGLMKELSSKVAALFEKYKVNLGDKSYLFEPRVFTIGKKEFPEIFKKSGEAMANVVVPDLTERLSGFYPTPRMYWNEASSMLKIGVDGGMNPEILAKVEQLRIFDRTQVSEIRTSKDLSYNIMANKKLMVDLSKAIFETLEQYDIKFSANEGCVFTPIVFEKPVYAQKVGVAKKVAEIKGFGPQVYSDPTPEPINMPVPGIVEFTMDGVRFRTPGVIAKRWWWIGIPPPEMLYGLDVMREFEKGVLKHQMV